MKDTAYMLELLLLCVCGAVAQNSTCNLNEIEYFVGKVNRPHPSVVAIYFHESTSVNAKFLSMSTRPLDMYWDDGDKGLAQGRILPGQESATNSYEGHVFFFTAKGNKSEVVARVKMESGKVIFLLSHCFIQLYY